MLGNPTPVRGEESEEDKRERSQGASSSEMVCIKREHSLSNDSGSRDFLAGLEGSASDRDSNGRSASI
jgi:hypothetical protein